MLLSTCSSNNTPVADGEQSNPISEYLRQVSGQEKEQDIVSIDHNYSKLWSCHPEANHTKPARMLFLKGVFQQNDSSSSDLGDISVDVESVVAPVVPPYDNPKSRALLLECDQFLSDSLPSESSEEKDAVNKTGWTTSQRNVYKHAMKILQGNRLSRLANSSSSSELVRRKISIDKGAGKMRQLFAANTWDMKLLGWLHRTLLDHLSAPLLSEYFEILKTLKVKVPSLIDKMLSQFGAFHASLFGASSSEAFTQMLRKPWDPVLNVLNQHKPNKLPGNPQILVVPSAPNQTTATQSQRIKFWNSHLSSMAKVIQLPVHASLNISVEESLNQIFTMTRNKIVELHSHSPKRPTIMLGWGVGGLLACHVALEEPVTAVVCLGFPMKGVSGTRKDLDDPILDSNVPTLFVIGQNSNTCSVDEIEDFRERMKAETGLVVVGGADDMLRVSVTKKRAEGITQSMVDRCLVDEVGDFLTPIFNQLCSGPSAAQSSQNKQATTFVQEQQVADDGKRQRRRPREYSPEISPVKKKARPVGRPSLQKVLSSSSSSDSSSIGSCVGEKALKADKKPISPKAKKVVEKLPRPQMPKSSIQIQLLNTTEANVTKEKSLAELNASNRDMAEVSPVSQQPSAISAKMTPAKILAEQQKNGPVDVEKAFGKDSSFLPRPLTPAEFDSCEAVLTPTTPGEKSELTSLVDQSAIVENETLSSPTLASVPSSKPLISVSMSSILAPSERQKISYLKTTGGSYPLTTFSTHVSSTVAIQKPQVVAKISESMFDSTKTCIMPVQKLHSGDVASSAGFSPSTPQAKILKNSNVSVKQVQGLVASLAGKGLLAAPPTSPSKSQTVFMGSQTSSKPATILVQTSEASAASPGKIQFRRMFVQGSSKVPVLSKLSSVDEVKSGIPEQRACNLSLLSDVAGMKEPIRHDTQLPSSATLVKLTPSNELKRIRVIEAVPSSSVTMHPQRLETPEELAEKQMAIRALNSSLNEEAGDSSFNYNIQPSKAEGNFLPRSSSMMGYSIVMPKPMSNLGLRPPYRRGRGRSSTSGFQMGRRPRVQRFYPF